MRQFFCKASVHHTPQKQILHSPVNFFYSSGYQIDIMDRLIALTNKQAPSQEGEVQIDEMKLVRFMEKNSHLEFFVISNGKYFFSSRDKKAIMIKRF